MPRQQLMIIRNTTQEENNHPQFLTPLPCPIQHMLHQISSMFQFSLDSQYMVQKEKEEVGRKQEEEEEEVEEKEDQSA